MNLKIEWSPRATNEYLNLIDYLLNEWGEKATIKFSNRLQTILTNISKSPKMYPATVNRENVRRCVVSKQTSLYYRVKKEKIEIVTLFYTRQNPLKRNL